MYSIKFEWVDQERTYTQTISDADKTLFNHKIIIGRGNAQECDITIKHCNIMTLKTVSRKHLEIFYNSDDGTFWAKNLTATYKPPKKPNPIMIDGKKIVTEVASIKEHSEIKLGQVTVKVKTLDISDKDNSEKQYIVQCSGPEKHSLDIKYQGLNCPYCGYIVLTGTIVKF